MALPVLILGESGTGKSASLRNFPQDDVAVINVAGKPLPFKNKIKSVNTDDYMRVDKNIRELSKTHKSIVVDDAQYLMANEYMRRSSERGYDKFTDIAKNFWALVNMCRELPSQVIVYFFAHIDRDANGNEKIKTIGKMLDEKITVEGMFTIVLKTRVDDGNYYFLTQNNGHDTTKSPIGMFPTYAIDNDLYYVDQKIRNYYEMDEAPSDEEMAEQDKEKANEDVKKETAGEKKGRRSRRQSDPAEDTSKPSDAESETAEEKRSRKKSADPESEPEKKTTERKTRKKRDPEPEPPADDAQPDMNEPEDPPTDMSGAKKAYDKAIDKLEEEKPKTRRRSRKAEKEEAAAEMAGEVASSGMDDVKDGEEIEIPFDEAPEPPVPETTRRRRRRKAE